MSVLVPKNCKCWGAWGEAGYLVEKNKVCWPLITTSQSNAPYRNSNLVAKHSFQRIPRAKCIPGAEQMSVERSLCVELIIRFICNVASKQYIRQLPHHYHRCVNFNILWRLNSARFFFPSMSKARSSARGRYRDTKKMTREISRLTHGYTQKTQADLHARNDDENSLNAALT